MGQIVASIGIPTLTMFHTHASMVTSCADRVMAACRKVWRTLGGVDHVEAHSTPPLDTGAAEASSHVNAEDHVL